jgi:hypothetical protein
VPKKHNVKDDYKSILEEYFKDDYIAKIWTNKEGEIYSETVIDEIFDEKPKPKKKRKKPKPKTKKIVHPSRIDSIE